MIVAFLGRYLSCPPWLALRINAREGIIMTSLSTQRTGFKNDFSVIANSFLHTPGLPLPRCWTPSDLMVSHRSSLRAGDIFSTQMVLWAFLAQTLRDGKGVACASAVADMATYLLQTGQRPPSGDTGVYCRARAAEPDGFQRLVRVRRQLEHR
jgi:hypothetical protein